MGDGPGKECGALPLSVIACPVCGGGIRRARAWTWINSRELFGRNGIACELEHCSLCPVSHPPEMAGLVWVGEKYYETPQDFTKEAGEQGISRRLTAIPKGFIVGETWVFLAHTKAVGRPCERCFQTGKIKWDAGYSECPDCKGKGKAMSPGIFHAFKPSRIEYVIKEDDKREKLERLQDRGVDLVRLERTSP
jgi:hypothetical protein